MKRLKSLLLLVSLILLTLASFAQDPGGNPDGTPPAVPFDGYMSLLLLLGGLVIVFIMYRKVKRRVS